jgi:nucleoside-diphosphate-sugar epimerase
MPTLAPNTGSKVLVTGANGYFALHFVVQLLEVGYSVRSTVRSAQKTEHLKKTFAACGDKFEVVVVEDTKVCTSGQVLHRDNKTSQEWLPM